jgi:Rieske Fe-S protein
VFWQPLIATGDAGLILFLDSTDLGARRTLGTFKDQAAMGAEAHTTKSPRGPDEGRRRFVSASSAVMACGLVGGYGAFAAMAGRYLFPARGAQTVWVFVAELDRMPDSGTIDFRSPDGRRVAITRVANTGTVEDFVALSSICPHLGCQVHWETQNERFFCPCHNGAFDAQGNPTAGPPKDANQPLARYPLAVERGLLFISVPIPA